MLRTGLIIFLLTQALHAGEFVLYNAHEELPCYLTKYCSSLEKQPFQKEKFTPQCLTIKAPSEQNVPIHFFDRNSDILLFCGQGFPGTAKKMGVFAALFPNYDIICVDYRWHTWKFYCRWNTIRHPINALIADEVEEVITALDYCTGKKKYKEVIGLGICYSNAPFIIAQTQKQYFTKLILDSCWLSLTDFADSITLDPWLPVNPTTGGTPAWIKKLLQKECIRTAILTIAHAVTPEFSLKSYLATLTALPILFIHGTHDLMVPQQVFWQIWDSVAVDSKFAFITPYTHSSAVYSRTLYNSMCQQFIENSPHQFWQACYKYQD